MKTYMMIERPSGEVEKVEWTKAFSLNDNIFKKVQEATKNAGKGNVLSWHTEGTIVKTSDKGEGWCDKCQSYCFGDCQS